MATKSPSVPATPGMMELTKEEKEALLEKKMEEIRRKNAALQKRHQEIEADRKAAEKSGMAVNPKLQTSTAPLSPKKDMKGVGEEGRTEDRRSAWAAGRGKRLKSNQDKPPNKDDSKEARSPGSKDGKPPPKDFHPLARDVGPLRSPTEEGNSSTAPNRGRRSARGGKPPIPGPTARNSNSPPPDPGYSFLADRGRQGPVPKDRPRRGRGDAFRHPRNFGGADFGDVRNKMRAAKERKGRHMSGLPPHPDLELTLTGRERREYLQWKEERDKIDQARILRQKAASGAWKREWDADKNENFEPPPPCPPSPKHVTPHRRPGRIGSGRFQHAQLAASADRTVVSLPGALRQGGRGTGRGRGYRDKASSPAPGRLRLRKASTSSDDRSVEPQHNSLVIKIDNEYAKAAESNQEKRVQFRMPNGNRGRGDASQGRGGRRGEQPANRGGGRRAGVGSGRLRPGSSWQPQDQEECWEDEGAIMPPVADTQPPPPPVNKPKATKTKTKPKVTAKPPAAPAAAAEPAATTNGTSEEKTEEAKKTEEKEQAKEEEEEMIHVNEEDLDDDDDDQWLDIDDPQDFYDMRHGDLGEFSDDEDAHNSSAESLERFIQEHTLRIDASTGLAAQTPPDSQNSQTSQGSDKGDQLNDSKGSGSDRVSPSKIGSLSDSEYEAAPSPSENMRKESVSSDTTKTEKTEKETESVEKETESQTVDAKPESESVQQPETPAEDKPESEKAEHKPESETIVQEAEIVQKSESESTLQMQSPTPVIESESDAVDNIPKAEPSAAVSAVSEKSDEASLDKRDAQEQSIPACEYADNTVQPETKTARASEDSSAPVGTEVPASENESVSKESETSEASEKTMDAEAVQQSESEETKQDAKDSALDLDSSCGSRSEEEKFEDAREGAVSSASSEATQPGSPAHKPQEISKEEETNESKDEPKESS